MRRKVKCCDYFKERQWTPSLVNRRPRRRRETQRAAVGRLFSCCLVIQSCSTLCDPMHCSLPGSSVHGVSQARILEWAAIPFSRGFSWHRDRTHISSISGFFTTEPPEKHLRGGWDQEKKVTAVSSGSRCQTSAPDAKFMPLYDAPKIL